MLDAPCLVEAEAAFVAPQLASGRAPTDRCSGDKRLAIRCLRREFEKRPSRRLWPIRKLSQRRRRKLEFAQRRPRTFQRKSREPPHGCRLSLRGTSRRVQHHER